MHFGYCSIEGMSYINFIAAIIILWVIMFENGLFLPQKNVSNKVDT
jgi:hypothetical protein